MGDWLSLYTFVAFLLGAFFGGGIKTMLMNAKSKVA
jgi:hypothetical protein